MAGPSMDRDHLWRILESVPAMVWMTDAEQRCLYANRATEAFGGQSRATLLGLDLRTLVHPDDAVSSRAALARLVEQEASGIIEMRMRRHDGAWRWLKATVEPLRGTGGKVIGMIGVNADVTDTRERDVELTRLNTHDPMTGLPNRLMTESLIEQAIDQARLAGRRLPVLAFGLDRFTMVNQSLGHSAGDQLLKEIGRRLSTTQRTALISGHLSGNRFVQIGEPGTGTETAYRAAARLLALCRAPFMLEELPHELTASVGIAFFPDDGLEAGDLMRAAEEALANARHSGGNGFAFYDRRQSGQAKGRLDMEQDLRRAIPRDELSVFYQPKVALPGYRLVGFEALVRWPHPEHGLLAPGLFVGLAEEVGLIKPMTRWVFEAVARDTKAWLAAGLDVVPIAINVSPREFLDGLMEEHLPAYQAHHLPDDLLEIEITESTMIEDMAEVSAVVEALKAQGIRVAMDDFGTGYSSLAGLNKLPISTLKIDRAFTKDIEWDRASRAVASGIISIARELGLDVVAEGVETEAQLRILTGLDCHVVQGFLTGRPMPAEQAEALLRDPGVLGRRAAQAAE